MISTMDMTGWRRTKSVTRKETTTKSGSIRRQNNNNNNDSNASKNETNGAVGGHRSSDKFTNYNKNYNNDNDNDNDDNDNGSLSSLSFYEDFPTLYFAVRRGKYVTNSVFLSWDTARRQIVDFPDADYIATPTLKQAHSYTNGFGAFRVTGSERGSGSESERERENSPPNNCSEEEEDCYSSKAGRGRNRNQKCEVAVAVAVADDNFCSKGANDRYHHPQLPLVSVSSPSPSPSPPISDTKPQNAVSPAKKAIPDRAGSKSNTTNTANANANANANENSNANAKKRKRYSTRRLLLDYYRLYDPGFKAKGLPPLTIPNFLKKRNMYKRKFRTFAKHWQRSGLLICCHDEKSLMDATRKYDTWIRDRKLERAGSDDEGGNDNDNNNDETQNNDNDNNNDKDDDKTKNRKRPVMMLNGPNSSSSPDSKTSNANSNSQAAKKRKKNSPATPSPTNTKASKSKKVNRKLDIDAGLTAFQTMQTATTIAEYDCSNEDDEDEDNDDNDESWNHMYEKLKAFHAEHGHCKVRKQCKETPGLAYWVQYNRRRMKPEDDRSGARALTLREEKLLNDLDFDPVYKDIVTEFNKYLGMRVAKLFEVTDDGSDDDNDNNNDNNDEVVTKTSRTTEKTFFGTVGRISSVCNRYLRIKYDDGDSEDFDKVCLLEGLTLYEKYKHLDTGRSPSVVSANPPAAVPATAAATAASRNKGNKNYKNGNNKTKSIITAGAAAAAAKAAATTAASRNKGNKNFTPSATTDVSTPPPATTAASRKKGNKNYKNGNYKTTPILTSGASAAAVRAAPILTAGAAAAAARAAADVTRFLAGRSTNIGTAAAMTGVITTTAATRNPDKNIRQVSSQINDNFSLHAANQNRTIIDNSNNHILAAFQHRRLNNLGNCTLGINNGHLGNHDDARFAKVKAYIQNDLNATGHGVTTTAQLGNITPLRNRSGGAENNGRSDGNDKNNNNGNDIGGDCSSDDEVEIIDVLTPYKGFGAFDYEF